MAFTAVRVIPAALRRDSSVTPLRPRSTAVPTTRRAMAGELSPCTRPILIWSSIRRRSAAANWSAQSRRIFPSKGRLSASVRSSALLGNVVSSVTGTTVLSSPSTWAGSVLASSISSLTQSVVTSLRADRRVARIDLSSRSRRRTSAGVSSPVLRARLSRICRAISSSVASRIRNISLRMEPLSLRSPI